MLGTQVPLVKATNFFGFDEWTVLVLLSKGVVDIPYANRPLELLWALPVPWITPHSFLGFAILHWAYLWLTAVLVTWIGIRLEPGRPLLALLAGICVLVWAPADAARLSSVERTLYGGITLGMTLCMAVYVESWVRRSVPLLAAALLLCIVSGRCYEATLPVLLATPLLLFHMKGGSSRELRGWILAFEGFVVLGMLLALQPLLFPTGDPSYLDVFQKDARAKMVLMRLMLQYRLHFEPLLVPRAAELHAAAVAVAALVGVGASLLWLRAVPPTGLKGDLRVLVGGGLLLCGSGYGALLLTVSADPAWRMQFLSSPGAALLLAGIVIAVSERLKRRTALVAVLLAAWITGVGTGRTRAMQRAWDRDSFYDRQMRMLSALVAAVPDVLPGSLIVLLDGGAAWRNSFSFHDAAEYLYRGNAVGLAWDRWAGMFPAFFGREGVVSLPWPAVRNAWGARATLHRYDEIVVVHHTPEGAVVVLGEWPPELPPLPTGASYSPRLRIRPTWKPIPKRRVLPSLEAGS